MRLQEIDKVSVTILMDNSTDLLLTNSIHANRPQLTTNEEFLLTRKPYVLEIFLYRI